MLNNQFFYIQLSILIFAISEISRKDALKIILR